MEALLRHDGHVINAPDTDLYNFVINLSTSTISLDEIIEWLKANTTGIDM